MHGIAPSEKDTGNAALEKRLRDAADQFRANSGLIFLRFASGRASPLALVMSLVLFLCGGCATPSPVVPAVAYHMHELGVVTDVLPLVVQPDGAKWRQLRVGLTEGEVTALLGKPYHKDPRPAVDAEPGLRRMYSWEYGEITFKSFTTKGTYRYAVMFHAGLVSEFSDPWHGKFSPDGRATVPELVLPAAGATLHHYPCFLDFRWHPSSGVYPIEYEIAVEVLTIDQFEAEHFEDYIRKTVDGNRPDWQTAGMSKKAMDELALSFAQGLRRNQGVMEAFHFRTHDIYLPLTWVGANTGRWHIRATNEKGTSDWTKWRYFKFST